MPKSLKRNKQQRAKDAKSFMKVPSRKMTRLEHARQNVFKSLTNTVNQNCSEFVILNKKENFEKLYRNAFHKIKDLWKLGFFFIILVLFFYG